MDIITSLKLIRQNLDEIPVTGICNQDRLVGCAHLLENVISVLEEAQRAQSTPAADENTEGKGNVTDG